MDKFKPYIVWFIGVLVVLLLLGTLKDILIKSVIEMTSSKIIGAKIKMGEFSLGLLNHRIHIKNFRMYNPPGFPDHLFLSMPEIAVQTDIPALIAGKMHFPNVVLNMDRMIIFKNKEGKMNVDALKIIEEQKQANKGKPMKLPVFQVDLLELNVGKVVLEDYSHAPPVHVDAYDVGIKSQKIRNINGLPKLLTAVLIQAMKPTAIRSAGLMAAEALLGVGFLPALAVGVAIAKDDVKADLSRSFDTVYKETLKLIQDLQGSVKKEDRQKGQILAKVYKCDITIEVKDTGWSKSHIMIKARQYMLAKLEIANGLLYQLQERLR
jgi:hypothetical protein